MPSREAGFLVFDLLRAGVLVRRDVRFYEDIPGYPRLVGKAADPALHPRDAIQRDADFFRFFPTSEDHLVVEVPAMPVMPAIPAMQAIPDVSAIPVVPAALPPNLATPIDVVQLSSDTE